MKVEHGTRIDLSSCNFCSGSLSSNGLGLEYNYTEVTTFTSDNSSGLKACICDKCLDELVAKATMNKL